MGILGILKPWVTANKKPHLLSQFINFGDRICEFLFLFIEKHFDRFQIRGAFLTPLAHFVHLLLQFLQSGDMGRE